MSDQIKLQWITVLGILIGNLCMVWVAWLAHRIHKNTNSLVSKLLIQADREGYDRATKEQKDKDVQAD